MLLSPAHDLSKLNTPLFIHRHSDVADSCSTVLHERAFTAKTMHFHMSIQHLDIQKHITCQFHSPISLAKKESLPKSPCDIGSTTEEEAKPVLSQNAYR